MNWLVFLFVFECGIIPRGDFLMYDRQPEVFYYEGHYYYPVSLTDIDLAPTFYVDLSVEFQFIDIFYIGGGVRIPMFFTGKSFDPNATYYDFQVGMRLGAFDFFWFHSCIHPQKTLAYYYTTDIGWESAYDALGIKVEGSFPLIKRKRR